LKAAIGDAICGLDDVPGTSGTSYDLENVLLDSASDSRSDIENERSGTENAVDDRQDHDPDCTCMDRMDSGRPFARHDWPCSCGYRKNPVDERQEGDQQ